MLPYLKLGFWFAVFVGFINAGLWVADRLSDFMRTTDPFIILAIPAVITVVAIGLVVRRWG